MAKKKMTPEEAIEFGQQGINEVTDQQIAEQEAQQNMSLLDEFRRQDQPDQVRNALVDAQDQQVYDTDKMITDMELSKQDYSNRTATQQKTNKATQLFGGITDAAASLVNIIGTTHGASPMKWESPQQGWAQKVDQITREREEKLDRYKNDLNTLRQKRAELKSAQTLAIAKYDRDERKLDAQSARWQADADAKLAKIPADARKAVASNANSILNTIIRGNVGMGIMPNESNMKEWTDMAYEAALRDYNGGGKTLLDKLKEGNK